MKKIRKKRGDIIEIFNSDYNFFSSSFFAGVIATGVAVVYLLAVWLWLRCWCAMIC